MKKVLFMIRFSMLLFLFISMNFTYAQQFKIGKNLQNIKSSAILELEDSTKALLLTRIANPTTSIALPWRGMILFDSTRNQLAYYDGTLWQYPGTVTTDTSIYGFDGTLKSNRIVNKGTNYLRFIGNTVGDTVVFGNNGKVGIGTATPTRSLHVNKGGILSDSLSLVGSASLLKLVKGVSGSSALFMEFYKNGTSSSDYGARSGYLGFGSSGNTVFSIMNQIGQIYIGSNNKSSIIVDTTGNVGIGTTSPISALQVSGAVRTDSLYLTSLDIDTNNYNAGLTVGVDGKVRLKTLVNSYNNILQGIQGSGGNAFGDTVRIGSYDNQPIRLYAGNKSGITVKPTGTSTYVPMDSNTIYLKNIAYDANSKTSFNKGGGNSPIVTGSVSNLIDLNPNTFFAMYTLLATTQITATIEFNGMYYIDSIVVVPYTTGGATADRGIQGMFVKVGSGTASLVSSTAGTHGVPYGYKLPSPQLGNSITFYINRLTNGAGNNFAMSEVYIYGRRAKAMYSGITETRVNGTLALDNVSTGVVGDSLLSIKNGVVQRVLPSSLAVTNIYTADGTLGGNRVVTMGTNNLTFSNTTGTVLLSSPSSNAAGLGFGNNGIKKWHIEKTVDSNLAFVETNQAERMRIKAGGNVGIATTNPVDKLTIGSVGSGFTATATPDAINLGGTFSNAAGKNPKLKLVANQDGSSIWGFGVSNLKLDYMVPSGSSHVFYVDTTEQMRINSNGNVGIGTASPVSKLHVSGAVRADSLVLLKLQEGASGDSLLTIMNGVVKKILAGSVSSQNIYNTNGTLNGARTVTMGNNTLTFQGNTTIFRGTNPINLFGVNTGTVSDSLLTISNGVVKKISSSTLTDTNIYNQDGTLKGNRVVTMGANDLTFSKGIGTFKITSNTDNVATAIDITGSVANASQSFFGLQMSSNAQWQTAMSMSNTNGSNKVSYDLSVFGSQNTSGFGKLGIYNGKAGGYSFVIDTTGKIGIGTTSPVSKLQVSGAVRADSMILTYAKVPSSSNADSILTINPNTGVVGKKAMSSIIPSVDTSIYSFDGTLKNNRVVTMGSNTLSFNGNTTIFRGNNPISLYGIQSISSTTANDSILTINAGVVKKIAPTNLVDSNIYTRDGTLSGNRVVTMGVNNLTFSNTTGTVLLSSPSSNAAGLGFGNNGIKKWHIEKTVDSNLAFVETNQAERMRITRGGNVGIANMNPVDKLTIGNVGNGFTSTATPDAINLGGTFSNAAGKNPKLKLVANADGSSIWGLGVSSSKLDYMVPSGSSHVFYVDTTEQMRINSNGKIGVGTISPVSKLHVSGAVRADSMILTYAKVPSSSNADSILTINPNTGVVGKKAMSSIVPSVDTSIYSFDGTLKNNRVVTMGANNLTFSSVNGNLIFNATGTGKVGIGTSTPVSMLEVVGGNGLVIRSGATWDALSILHNGSTAYFSASGADSGIAFRTNTLATGDAISNSYNEHMRILPNGNVGIGTKNPLNLLHVAGTAQANNLVLTNLANGATSDVALVIDGSGNVKKSTSTASNIYTADGTLGGNRVVTMGNNDLTFSKGTGTFKITSSTNDVATAMDISGSVANANQSFFGLKISSNAKWQTAMSMSNINGSNTVSYDLSVFGSQNTSGFGKFGIYNGKAGGYSFVIDTTGKIGIGTDNPVDKLTIGNVGSGFTSMATPDAINMAGTFSNAAGRNPKLKLVANADGSQIWGFGVSSNQLDYMVPSSSSHVFYINATEQMRINSNGIGIGTNPSQKLDVNGTAKANNLVLTNLTNGTTSDVALVIDGSGNVKKSTSTASNIYTADGTLGGNRVVTMGNNSLTFAGGSANYVVFNAATAGNSMGIRFNDAGTQKWHIEKTTTNDLAFVESNVEERMRIKAGGNVGIATINPSQKLDVNGTAKANNLILTSLANGATSDATLVIDASGNVKKSTSSGTNIYNSNGTLTGARTVTMGGNNLNFSGGSVTFSNTVYAPRVQGVSDARLKKDVSPIQNSLSKVLQLQGVTYTWRKDMEKQAGYQFKDGIDYGVIAQDIQKVLPELVQKDSKGFLTVDYQHITPVLIEAIKEQQSEIQSLKDEVQELKSMLNEIKQLIKK